MSNEIIDPTAIDAIAQLEAQMAAMADQMATSGGSIITMMSAKSGMLNIEGQPVQGNAVDAVIVDVWAVNEYYEGTYDPDALTWPVCKAYDRNPAMLQPADGCEAPQHKSCEGCPKNEWGSGLKKGKACKNGRLVVFAMADALAKGSNKLFALRVPVTSVKNLTQFSAVLASSGLSPMRVRTQISVKPDPKTQFKMHFALVEKLPADAKQMQLIMDAFNKSSTTVPQMLAPVVKDDEESESENEEPATTASSDSKKF